MRPPMNQEVTIETPKLGKDGKPIKDRYGRPQTETRTSIARVQFRSQSVVDNLGIAYEVALEIDLPPEVIPDSGMTINYTTIDGREGSGTIRAVEEITNIAGNRIHYRTVFVE